MLATYGSAVIRPGTEMSYAEYVGLQLNIPRIRMVKAIAHVQAINATRSNDPLGRDWADALAPSEELVDEDLYQANGARKEESARAKLNWGSGD